MGKDVRSASNSAGLLLAAALALGACAESARPLPPDASRAADAERAYIEALPEKDRAMTCAQLAEERVALDADIAGRTAELERRRGGNAVATYLGGMFIVPWLAIDTANDEAAQLRDSQARIDVLLRLKSYRRCG